MSTVFDLSAVAVDQLDGGRLWRIRLNAPKANVLDATMVRAVTEVVRRAAESPDLQAILLEGAGPNFSFGASVEEHLPDRVEDMLHSFHGMFRALTETSAVLLAAVRGQCLGGGLELAAFCHRVFAAPDATLGQPEIRLGVFAPVASLVLPERMGRPAAEDLCLSGRSLTATEAHGAGLVDELAADPGAAAVAYAREHLMSHSASSLRLAVMAVRHAFHARFLPQLAELERLYLEQLMRTADAKEGVRAFVEKRDAHWVNQ